MPNRDAVNHGITTSSHALVHDQKIFPVILTDDN